MYLKADLIREEAFGGSDLIIIRGVVCGGCGLIRVELLYSLQY
jgi:hypothetical protein